ncbi:putative glutamine-dependent NAD(+) synthetase [Mesotoga infera]|uniref:Glutamine-dependent NAD(+) synthetase n=2 Tax=Mesotoga infera TaxID=1236046 RepID=A0A7Z7LGH0_9BACT|nr:NAD+ synthase [Mesotoga infera]SSC13444.1 putative glutamine-dependent NAD(+) synthetase [Mesotoga infera]HNS66894.1 NAD+ synthase [Mesotoga infera]
MIIRTAMAQINTTVGDLEGNKKIILSSIDSARSAGAGILLFPELTITGYPPEDLLLHTGFLRDNIRVLKEVEAYTTGSDTMVVVGFVDFSLEIYNAAAIIQNGEIKGVYRKMNLPNYSVFDERRYFTPGSRPLIIMSGSLKIGVNICEDIWVPAGPTNDQAIAGANLILNLSASPFTSTKNLTRMSLLQTRAMEYSCCMLYCNHVGGQDELVFDGRSTAIMPDGHRIVARSFEEDFLVIDIDTDQSTRYNLLEGKRKGYCKKAEVEEINVIIPQRKHQEFLPEETYRVSSEEDDLIDSLVLGLRDYTKKNGFKKVVLGLSGGMDSSLVAALAVKALGKENVIGVMMPSRITSDESKKDAVELAKNLGIETFEIPIESVFDSINGLMRPVFSDRTHDVTEENFQARIRGIILMGLSNKFGWLVLATGNKSEMATGYATLYGDMAGGLAILKDLYKTQIYRIAKRINEQTGTEIIPRNVFLKAPTAELREGQKDQDSLPPYEILDGILRLYIEESFSLDEIVSKGFDRETVEYVLRLLQRSEYKRKQGAPGIKVSKRAFGKDWRMPITNKYRD